MRIASSRIRRQRVGAGPRRDKRLRRRTLFRGRGGAAHHRPMRPLALLLLLAACAVPPPRFMGEAPQVATLDGVEYRLWRQGDEAHVIRLGSTLRVRDSELAEGYAEVALRLTGCRAKPFDLSQRSVVTLRLDCP